MNKEADSIFFSAREIDDPEQRLAFLQEACGNVPALLGKVQELLAAEGQAEAYFGDSVVDDDRTVAMAPGEMAGQLEHAGLVIGRYKLLQKIGEGGFGSVWMAEQTEPVTRRVALKIIKQGMDTHEVIARFEAERQALAMMDHPNIARVFDAGATPQGRPYFVMELVKGMPVTQFCIERKLTTRQRLELFGDICSAVNHAHQKGIIHRDLKPSNVMVTLHGDQAVPKVIDFGIAKATESKLTEKTLFTRFDQFIGTPAYMSPEQAALSGLDIDTRVDIYALGALLYELLAGQPPFDAKSLISAGYDEMRRIIQEDEPPKPSLRFSTAHATDRNRISTTHGAASQNLARTLKGDLDLIVMKAIDKDRSRRYETANDFAADIRHYLANEPVSAAAPSVRYRFQKFARRNKGAILVAGTFAAVLVVATGVSTWQAFRATAAERRVSGLLDESKTRQQELHETVTLLTESTTELTSHMRRFVIGTWDFKFELDEERGKREMEAGEWAFFKSFLSNLAGDFSSQLKFKEDGSSEGSTTFPALLKSLAPHENLDAPRDGQWDLISQIGKKTTVKVTNRGMGGIRNTTEFTVTVLDSDTLKLENTQLEDQPFKPFIFKRIK
jgi:serine/threonine protein kinase